MSSISPFQLTSQVPDRFFGRFTRCIVLINPSIMVPPDDPDLIPVDGIPCEFKGGWAVHIRDLRFVLAMRGNPAEIGQQLTADGQVVPVGNRALDDITAVGAEDPPRRNPARSPFPQGCCCR